MLLRCFTLITALFASTVSAGELGTEEMINRFGAQISSLGKSRNVLSKPKVVHRGLVIVPVPNEAGTTMEEIEFVAVDQDEQVNVQVVFDVNSSVLRADQKPRLGPVCEAMSTLDGTLFQVIGHTDASGSTEYNDRLSVFRAESVSAYLIDVCGIANQRLQAIGVGERYLLDVDRPNAEVNRRVEFQAVSAVGG